jgi:outer membrane receptor protein involved in Fe transport
VRIPLRAAAAFALSLLSLVGPVSAAPSASTLAPVTQQQGTLSGTVTDSRGNPLAGASVTVHGPGSVKDVTTAGDGSFHLAVPAGVYTITIARGGYQGLSTDDIAIVAGTATTLHLPLADATASTLRVIGGTQAHSSRAQINRDITAQASIPTDELQAVAAPTLDNLIQQIPGVTLQRGNRSTVAQFNVRGATYETRVEIDGHPTSTGQNGTFLTGLLNPDVFENIDIEKGAGVSSADAGESAFGTINMRTWDFSDKPEASIKTGFDSYAGQYDSVLFRGSFLKDKKLSIVANVNTYGYNGPSYNDKGVLAVPGTTPETAPANGGLALPGNPGTALGSYTGLFGAGQLNRSETYKLRWRFSDSTSAWIGYVGSQSAVEPQGSAYGSYDGTYVIAPCYSVSTGGKTAPVTKASQCGVPATGIASYIYNSPSVQPFIGQTVNLYSAYPNGRQFENAPLFEGEFRTAINNDTLLIRPYTETIQRINDGGYEPDTPGNSGQFGLVTSPTQCSAAVPCYQAGSMSTPFTSAGNACATSTTPVAGSCYSPVTFSSSNGKLTYSNGTPYMQDEYDSLHGVTLQYLHPVKDGILRFGYEYNSDMTEGTSGYAPGPGTPLPSYTLPNGFTYPAGVPNLGIVNTTVPATVRRSNDFSLATFLQPSEKLSLAAGLFYNIDRLQYSTEDPAVLALAQQYPTQTGGYKNLPLDLITGEVDKSHLDPHFGIVYNYGPRGAVRFNAGSSVTLPYASQVSGIPSYSPPSSSNGNQGQFSEKNPNLLPETTVAYDIGTDYRLPDGGVLSVDGFDDITHNRILSEVFLPPNPVSATARVSYNFNAGDYRTAGLEFSARKETLGLGYDAQLTLLRAYFTDLGPSYYSQYATGSGTTTYNWRQPDGIPFSTAHAALVFRGTQDFRAEFGADYTGSNNTIFIPAYTLLYSSLKFDLGKQTALQFGVYNLNNQQTLAGIAGAGPTASGMSTVRCTFTPDGSPGACNNYTNQVQQLPPRTFTVELQEHI